MSEDLVGQRLREAAEAAQALGGADLTGRVARAAAAIVACYRADGRTLWLGNGGSAAQADHLAAELVGRYLRDRPPLSAIALSVNASAVTALGNDYGYETSFARQVEAHARPGDVVVGLTTSGSSPNVVAALRCARERGGVTIALTGGAGGAVAEVADHLLAVPSDQTPRIQEGHLVIGHTLCELVERALFGA